MGSRDLVSLEEMESWNLACLCTKPPVQEPSTFPCLQATFTLDFYACMTDLISVARVCRSSMAMRLRYLLCFLWSFASGIRIFCLWTLPGRSLFCSLGYFCLIF